MICQEGLTQKGFFFSPSCTSLWEGDLGLWKDSIKVWDMMQHQCIDFTIIVKCFFRFLEVNPLR